MAVYFGMCAFKRHKASQSLGARMALGLKTGVGVNGRVHFFLLFLQTSAMFCLFVFLLWHPAKAMSALCNQRRTRAP